MRRLSRNERLRKTAAVGASLALVWLAGCAGSDMTVETGYDEAYDFSSLKTFGFQTGVLSMPDGSDIDPLVAERIESAVIGTLEGKGLVYDQTGNPDFVAIVRGGRLETVVVNVGQRDNIYVPQDDWVGDPDVYDEGALLIGMMVSGSTESIWHGVGKVRLEGGPASQEQFDKWVAKILKDFPPK